MGVTLVGNTSCQVLYPYLPNLLLTIHFIYLSRFLCYSPMWQDKDVDLSQLEVAIYRWLLVRLYSCWISYQQARHTWSLLHTRVQKILLFNQSSIMNNQQSKLWSSLEPSEGCNLLSFPSSQQSIALTCTIICHNCSLHLNKVAKHVGTYYIYLLHQVSFDNDNLHRHDNKTNARELIVDKKWGAEINHDTTLKDCYMM